MLRHLPALALLTLAACSPTGDQSQAPDNAIRIALPTEPAPLELPPQQPEGAVWSNLANGGVAFGLPGQPALLEVACTHAGDGTALVRYTRRTRAEAGAKALLAIEGNRHVARVPVDVVKAGDPGEWQGAMPARLETAGAIKGGAEMTATLPGGGALKLPPYPGAGALLDSCRASDAKPAPKPETKP
jgi:hypothetical protein